MLHRELLSQVFPTPCAETQHRATSLIPTLQAQGMQQCQQDVLAVCKLAAADLASHKALAIGKGDAVAASCA